MAISQGDSGYRGPAKAKTSMTIKALQERQKQAALAAAKSMEMPQQISDPWQAAAHVLGVAGAKFGEARAASQESEARDRLAAAMTKRDPITGAYTPEALVEISTLDPERGYQLTDAEIARAQKLADWQRDIQRDDFEFQRTQADQTEDEKRAAAQRKLETEAGWTHETETETARNARELQETLDTEKRKAEAGAQRIITGDEAAAFGGDPTKQYRVTGDRSKLEEVRPNDPLTEAGRIEADFAAGAYGDPNNPNVQAYKEQLKQKAATASGDINIMTGEVEARKKIALDMGLKEGTPEYQTYVLTGNIPKGERVTVNEQKEIMDAEDLVNANQATIDTLTSVLTGAPGQSLNERAGSGMFAGAQAAGARNDPTGVIFDAEQGKATTELQNKILGNALASLKSIFGGNPTEGERQILVDLQASIDKTPDERRIIINNAIALAQKRLTINQQRARQLREGTYFQPGGGSTAAPAPQSGGDSGGGGGGKAAPATPKTQADFDALAPGTEYISPADGQTYIK